MHSIESELIKACEFKPRKKYNDRQEYLRAILVAANKLSDDDFDLLSDDAANWVDACIRVHNAHKNEDLPDFDEVGDVSEDETSDEEVDDDAADEADEDEAESDEGDEESDDDGDDEDGSDEADASDETDTDEEPEDGDDEEDEPEEVEVAPKPTRKKSGPVPKPKPPKGQPPVSVSAQKKLKNLPEEEGDVELDKWGCMVGSKNSLALAMFEKGATSKEIKAELGGTYYNILTKMVQRGHKLEREGTLMKLTHMNEVASKPKKSKK